MKYIELEDPIYIYCPVMKADIEVTSDEIEKINKLDRFILFSVKKGKGMNMVTDITLLKQKIIEEEFDYLEKTGLIKKDEYEKFFLTKLGKRFETLISKIEKFNNKHLTVLINKYSGEIMDNEEVLTRKHIEENRYCLPNRVLKLLYRNLDPSNSKDYLFQKGYFNNLNEKEREELHTKIFYKNWDFFKKMSVNKIPIRLEENFCATIQDNNIFSNKEFSDLNPQRYIWLQRDYIKFKIIVDNIYLSKNKKLIDSLNEIYQKKEELLSKKGKIIIKLLQKVKQFNKKENIFYFDQFTGEIFFNIEEDSPDIYHKKIMNLPKKYDICDITEEDIKSLVEKEIKIKDLTNWNFRIEKSNVLKKNYKIPLEIMVNYYNVG